METTLKNVLSDAFWIMPATPKYKNQGIPYITSKNIKNRRISFNDVKYIDKADYDVISKNRPILENDILISMIGTLGEVAVVQKEDGCFYGQNMYLIRLDESKISQKYFLNWVESDAVKRAILQQQNKSTQSYLKAEHIEGLLINVPNMIEQDRIAVSLEKINAVIEKRKQQLQKLDEFVKARFVEMFGLPVANTKCWNTEKMSVVAPVANYVGDFDDDVWLLNLDMIEAQSGRILDYLIVGKNEVGSSTCTFDTSNVLYSKLRPYLNKVVIPDRCGYATSELIPLQPIRSKINREYLTFVLRSAEFVAMINEKVVGAKMPRVSMSDFRNFDVPVPPLELQNKFADFVRQNDKSKLSVQKSLDKLELLKKALMQKYFG